MRSRAERKKNNLKARYCEKPPCDKGGVEAEDFEGKGEEGRGGGAAGEDKAHCIWVAVV